MSVPVFRGYLFNTPEHCLSGGVQLAFARMYGRFPMSATGLDVFDKTLQTTHIWLDEIMAVTGPDRHVAWHVLGAVLRTVRDRVPVPLAAHLGAELPILVRGIYYDQWHVADQPERYRSADEFLRHVADKLGAIRPVNWQDATRAVFNVLTRHVARGQIEKIRDALPEDVRDLWRLDLAPAGELDAEGNEIVAAHPETARNIRS
jgi:uncharacterized protein (DUF2267 family)